MHKPQIMTFHDVQLIFFFIFIYTAENLEAVGESSSEDEDANNKSKAEQITDKEQPESILRAKNNISLGNVSENTSLQNPPGPNDIS